MLLTRQRTSRGTHRLRGIVTATLLATVCLLALLTVVIPFVLGAQSYTVLTGSMRPALEPGALIAVRPTSIDDIRVGDIVTYQLRSGEPEVVTHRVVGVGFTGDGERILTTQGDANNVADAAPVRDVQVRGTLVYAMPWLGYLNIWATPAVKSLLITVLGVAAIGWGIIVLLRDAARRRKIAQSASVAAALVLAALIAPAGSAPASASTPPPDPRLLLSADGVIWTAHDQLTLLDGSTTLVPGSALDLTLWVRNNSPDPAEYRIELHWRPYDKADSADVALASALRVPATPANPSEIEPDSQVQVPLRIHFSAESGNASRLGSAQLQVRVTLTEQTTRSQPLPATGSDVPILAISVAAVLLVAGGAALFIQRKRRDRRD